MAHFDSVEQVIQALVDVGYTEEEIDYITGDGWDKLRKLDDFLTAHISPSEYIMSFIKAKEPYTRNDSTPDLKDSDAEQELMGSRYDLEEPKRPDSQIDPLDNLPF